MVRPNLLILLKPDDPNSFKNLDWVMHDKKNNGSAKNNNDSVESLSTLFLFIETLLFIENWNCVLI